jgi:signal transduction histidine kinase/CheY-like chemotaxis protein
MLHPDDVDRSLSRYHGCIQSGQPYQIEYRFKDRFTGGYRWFMGRALPIRNDGGEVVRWFGACTDIDDVKQAEAALRAREEELRDLTERLEQRVAERTRELVDSQTRLRDLATELNLTEQRERKRLATELHDHLQQLLVLGKLKLGQGKRLAEAAPVCADIMQQTDEVLTEALSYTRTLVAELSPPVLREHGFAASLKWLAEYMRRHGMTIAVMVPEEDGPDLSEEQAILLFQSVRELLINASKYAGTDRAGVTLEVTTTHLRIAVRDEGKGCDPVVVSTESDPPSGLSSKFGLYSIRERMKALGGAFEMVSAPGKGTTATLTLPLPRIHKASTEQVATTDGLRAASLVPTAQPSEKGIIRVLLVDDHAMMRQGLRSVLEGYANVEVVGEACDGEEAVRTVETLQPHVVVMDINMPHLDGIAATQRIHAQHPHIVVIGLSVNASGENQDAMTKAGAALLLTKEGAVEQLYLAIRQTVALPPHE